MHLLSNFLFKIAGYLIWGNKIKEDYGIDCLPEDPGGDLDPIILRQTYFILRSLPRNLVKDCKISKFYFSTTMGPNKSFWPNHGFFRQFDRSITLNVNIFYHPDLMEDFFDDKGYFISRPYQTIYHELGHAFDDIAGNLSLKPSWLKLSGWSKVPKPGLKRLVIKDDNFPPIFGDWYFDPSAEFTRFYGKRNPEDDWADCFSFYVAGMYSKVPEKKRTYFDFLLKKYY